MARINKKTNQMIRDISFLSIIAAFLLWMCFTMGLFILTQESLIPHYDYRLLTVEKDLPAIEKHAKVIEKLKSKGGFEPPSPAFIIDESVSPSVGMCQETRSTEKELRSEQLDNPL